MDEIEMLKRRLAREREARKQAETILEKKALELFEANQTLKAFNTSLEEQIEERSKQLVSKERQYKVLVNNASDIIFTVDEEGYFLMVNPVGLRRFGYSEEDILGARYVDFIPEEHREAVFDFYTQMKEGGDEESYLEFPVVTATGELVWMGQSVTKTIEDGKRYYSAVARDITEKVNHLRALKTVNRRFSALLENLLDGILVEDEHRRVVLVNQAFINMFQLPISAEQLTGADCRELAANAAPYFVDEEKFLERIELIQHKQELVLEEELHTKSGRILSRNFIPILIEGRNQGVLWYYSDITERRNQELILRRSEEKYRGIMENMELGILEVDNEDIVVRAYDRFNKMTGYEDGELIGKKASDALAVEGFRKALMEQDSQRKEGISGVYEMKIRKKDQSEVWVLVSGAPYYDETGKIVGSIGLHYDISTRKKLEEELEKARQEAVDAQQAEKQFLASMSHEIRTPLNAIIGMTHLLGDTDLSVDQDEYLKVLGSSASLLKNLISDILDISKIDAGSIDLQEKAVDLRQIGRQLLSTLSINAKGEGLSFTFDFDPTIEYSIISDAQLLSQILLNLLGNAKKFTKEGAISLRIKLEEETELDYELYFSVEDTGIGMDEAELQQVFEQFKQASADIREKYGGTGLGLPISKRLVALLGGDLQVKSVKGMGSEFFFRLRLPKGPLLSDLSSQSKQTVEVGEIFRGKQALIVEDNDMNIKYLSTLLTKWGLGFQVAKNGQQAVERFKTSDFDIIFMDLQMPIMDGYEASRRIRAWSEKGAQIPIIALTASTFLSKKQLAMKAGLSDFVSKPFTPEQLSRVMSNYLGDAKAKATEASLFSFTTELDSKYLGQVYGDDLVYAHEMFTLFLDMIDEELAKLHKASEQADLPEIKRLVHKLKPTFSMVGLTVITSSLAELEGKVLDQEVVKTADELKELDRQIQQDMAVLKRECNRLAQEIQTDL